MNYEDDDIDLTFGIAHLNLHLNTPIALQGNNAPLMVNNGHKFSSDSRMTSSWGKREVHSGHIPPRLALSRHIQNGSLSTGVDTP
jgi:hypothetical protein